MKWRSIKAKATGTSHAANNEPCQDCYAVGEVNNAGTSSEIFFVFVSDGAGSATQGKKGAEIACASAQNFLKNLTIDVVENIQESNLLELFEIVVDELKKNAIEDNLILRDYACTFLGVIVSTSGVSYIQIGDGAIVIKLESQENYNTIFWPDTGEYANETNFITDEDAISNLRCKCIYDVPVEFAVFTDGLQRLCLRFEDRVVHSPFFTPMFSTIKECPNEAGLNKLNDKLNEFLNSQKINERTDDDKTLVLAVRIENEQ